MAPARVKKKEAVNHPSHYGGMDNPYEAIKVIEAWKLNFNLGNSVKYIARESLKGVPIEDLQKAAWYLSREIKNRIAALAVSRTARRATPTRKKTRSGSVGRTGASHSKNAGRAGARGATGGKRKGTRRI